MSFGFVIDDGCPDKVAAGGPGEFALGLTDQELASAAHAATCPACGALDEPYGCVGLVATAPLAADAERWLVERLPEDIESLPGFLLRKAIGDYGYDGTFGRALREAGQLEAPGPFTRHFGPFFRRFTVSSEQLLEELFGAGDVMPPHALACLVHLGAIAVDGRVLLAMDDGAKLGELVANPETRRERTRCTVAPAPDDSDGVAALKRYLRALWAGFVTDATVRIFGDGAEGEAGEGESEDEGAGGSEEAGGGEDASR